MTEQKWLDCADPRSMLAFLRTASPRKLRLFACGCCRIVWHLLSDERSRHAVEAAESWADGDLLNAGLKQYQIVARAAQDERTSRPGASFDAESEAAVAAACVVQPNKAFVATTANSVRRAVEEREGRAGLLRCERLQCELIRDIFGNPFRPVTVSPTWLTSDVTAIARGIYMDRAFDRLPILVDALLDTGCDREEVLAHCRSAGPHSRGCWAVDLMLGNS